VVKLDYNVTEEELAAVTALCNSKETHLNELEFSSRHSSRDQNAISVVGAYSLMTCYCRVALLLLKAQSFHFSDFGSGLSQPLWRQR
jgi:hypothetical protein